jgi:hypothetical protein
MERVAAFLVFTVAIWCLVFAETYFINVIPRSESLLNPNIPFAGSLFEGLIVAWSLYFVFGIKTWPRTISGGTAFGTCLAVANYYKIIERVTNYHAWPTKYFGVFVSDSSGNINGKFWLLVAAFGVVGFVMYVFPAGLAKRVSAADFGWPRAGDGKAS